MKSAAWVGIALALAAAPVRAGDDRPFARMALCQDSWVDWQKNDPAQLKAFAARFRSGFSQKEGDAFVVPKADMTVAGLHIAEVFPESVGMGVGFSVVVDAPFDTARHSFEKALGRKLGKCETSDDMRSCELQIAEKRTIMLMAEDNPKATQTLLGCYYFYEK
jgi:hypothetical protein